MAILCFHHHKALKKVPERPAALETTYSVCLESQTDARLRAYLSLDSTEQLKNRCHLDPGDISA